MENRVYTVPDRFIGASLAGGMFAVKGSIPR